MPVDLLAEGVLRSILARPRGDALDLAKVGLGSGAVTKPHVQIGEAAMDGGKIGT